MKLTPLEFEMAYLIDLEPIEDARGFFARAFCEKELGAAGLETRFVQHGVSWNEAKGTLRGMHYQAPPHGETKIVRCTRGAVYDVMVDLRPGSKTYGRWLSVELTAENRCMVYIPEGLAHGFQTLEPGSEVFYLLSAFHTPGAERGVRWNDPYFGIEWPLPPSIMSDRDRQQPDFSPDRS